MEQINTKIKRWGNSFGIVVPMEIIKKEELKEDADVTVTIQTLHKMTGKDLMELGKKFGIAKKLKDIDVLKALKEVDRVFWPEEN